jgi:hypothetical protein
LNVSGNGASRIFIIGDSSFIDYSKYAYDRNFSLIGINKEDVLTGTILPETTAEEIQGWITRYQCRVIIPMGIITGPTAGLALQKICGVSGLDDNVCYVLPTHFGIPAVPTYHPSFVMKGNHKLTPSVLFAFKRAQEIANGSYHESKYELLIDPAPEVVRRYVDSGVDNSGHISSLFVDIETPESGRLDEEDIEGEGSSFNIIRAGFSVRTNSAVTFPWCHPYIDILQTALSRADEFVEWADNRFDSRRIAAAGLKIPSRIVSAMWVWHWLQSDLRKGLGKVAPFFYAGPPWKHLNAAEPGRYNALDVAIGRAIYEGAKAALEAQ